MENIQPPTPKVVGFGCKQIVSRDARHDNSPIRSDPIPIPIVRAPVSEPASAGSLRCGDDFGLVRPDSTRLDWSVRCRPDRRAVILVGGAPVYTLCLPACGSGGIYREFCRALIDTYVARRFLEGVGVMLCNRTSKRVGCLRSTPHTKAVTRTATADGFVRMALWIPFPFTSLSLSLPLHPPPPPAHLRSPTHQFTSPMSNVFL
ncbi:hypothetical protein C7212DRAFT_341969 [Tuber magnatum]|uniref:Uncharacterized protein n=1 Tax=Tuber magnatum TaxID=42249 RepID=A0A317T0P1_9PEZI|nr:hypothetical protein C7212DRAFT_341969 [Tuber magnatum]